MGIEAVLALIGGIALLVGIFGGGIEAEKIKIPQIGWALRIILTLTGTGLLVLAVFLSRPDLLQAAVPVPATAAALPRDPPVAEEPATPTFNPQNALNTYDNFDNPANDGTYDPEKWGLEGSSSVPQVRQQNGSLTIVNAGDEPSGNLGLRALWFDGITLDLPMFIEADLALSADSAPGSVRVSITTSDLAMGTWFAQCGIEREGSRFQGSCSDFVWPEQTEHSFETPKLYFEPGSWHTFRIEVDPASMTITYSIDGIVAGSHVPTDAGLLRDAKFQFSISTWKSSVNSPVLGLIDSVSIGQIGQ